MDLHSPNKNHSIINLTKKLILFFVFIFFFYTHSFAQEQRSSSIKAQTQSYSDSSIISVPGSIIISAESKQSGSGLFLEYSLVLNPNLDLILSLDRNSNSGEAKFTTISSKPSFNIENDSRILGIGFKYFLPKKQERAETIVFKYTNIEVSSKSDNYTPASSWTLREGVTNGEGSGFGIEGSIYYNSKIDFVLGYASSNFSGEDEGLLSTSNSIRTSKETRKSSGITGGVVRYLDSNRTPRKDELKIAFNSSSINIREDNYTNSTIKNSATETSSGGLFIEYNRGYTSNLDLVFSAISNSSNSESKTNYTNGTQQDIETTTITSTIRIGFEYYFGQDNPELKQITE